MKLSFPITLKAMYVGRTGSAGSFTDDEGRDVEYAENLGFDFEDADGNVQRLTMRANNVASVSASRIDFDKLQRYKDEFVIEGNLILNTEKGGRSFFKALSVAPAKALAAAA
jgi:hypothetical protein